MFNTIIQFYFVFLNYFYPFKQNEIKTLSSKEEKKLDLSNLYFFKFRYVSVEKRVTKSIYNLEQNKLSEVILWYKYTVKERKE